MSNSDNVPIPVRGRPYSSDINNLQSLQNRLRNEMLRWMLADEDTSGIFTERSFVLGGLRVIGAGAPTVQISAGMMAQYSLTLTPAAGPLDSNMRLGRSNGAIGVAIPSTVATAYHIVEARVSLVQTTQLEDQLDTLSGVFLPVTIPALDQYEVEFQVVAGASGGAVPAPTGGDWVPIAVVRRGAGGAPVAAADVVNLQTRFGNSGAFGEMYFNRAGEHIVEGRTFGSPIDTGRLETLYPAYVNGLPFQISTALDVSPNYNPDAAQYLAVGTVFAANTWYYAYLSPVLGLGIASPINASVWHGSPGTGTGLIVTSSTPPVLNRSRTRVNSASFVTPAPWTNTVSAGRAVCIGAFLRNSANTGWVRTAYMSHTRVRIAEEAAYIQLGTLATDAVGPLFTDINLTSPGIIPVGVKSVQLRLHQALGPIANYAAVISVRETGGGGAIYATHSHSAPQGVLLPFDIFMEIPLAATGTAFSLVVQNILGPCNGPAEIELIGFEW